MHKILGNYSFPNNGDCDVVCFDGMRHEPGRAISTANHLRFDEILRSLPDGWEPDLVIMRSVQYEPIPLGIENSRCPTILLLEDWFSGLDFLPDNFKRFDFIFTDKYSISLLQKLGCENVEYFPCFGHNPADFYLSNDFSNRLYDITFAGSLNINVQQDRLPWLRKLCLLDKKYNVRIFHSLWGKDYPAMLNNSKIVFNRSIKGEMNLRTFEAAACGALLFLEEENREIREFLEPGKECVLYREDNLEELLGHYLSHEDERVQIARHGNEKIQQYSYPKLFSRLIERICRLEIRPGLNRNLGSRFYTSIPLHRDLVQISMSGAGSESVNENILGLLPELLENKPQPPWVCNDAAVMLAACIENTPGLSETNAGNLRNQVREILDHSREQGSLTALFNKAQLSLAWKDFRDAQECYNRLLGSDLPHSSPSCMGQVYPTHYRSPLRVSWSAAALDGISDVNKFIRNRYTLMRCFSALGLAQISEAQRDDYRAANWYRKSLDEIPQNPTAITSLALKAKGGAEIGGLFSLALLVNPFNISIWRRYAEWLIMNDRNHAVSFIKNCLLCLNRVQFSSDSDIAEFNTLLAKSSAVPERRDIP